MSCFLISAAASFLRFSMASCALHSSLSCERGHPSCCLEHAPHCVLAYHVNNATLLIEVNGQMIAFTWWEAFILLILKVVSNYFFGKVGVASGDRPEKALAKFQASAEHIETLPCNLFVQLSLRKLYLVLGNDALRALQYRMMVLLKMKCSASLPHVGSQRKLLP